MAELQLKRVLATEIEKCVWLLSFTIISFCLSRHERENVFFSSLDCVGISHGRTHARTHARTHTHTHSHSHTHTHTHTYTKTQTKNSIWRITRRLAQINKFSGWLKATGLKKEKRKISLKSMFRSVAESTSVKLLRHSARSLNSGYLTNRTWLL